MDWLIALVALTAMEIVLGIDNIVFIAILAGRLPEHQQAKARNLGLAAALVTRLALLMAISWVIGLKEPLFSFESLGVRPEWLGDHPSEILEVSWRDLIMLGGGLFLIGHSVKEIHHQIEPQDDHKSVEVSGFGSVIFQIAVMDMIFSLDSVITAVGMVEEDKIWVMVVAIVTAMAVMLLAAGTISAFVGRHPTIKVLALSFLILIGVLLVAEGIGTHFNKGYVYFAMAFSLIVEMVNMRVRRKGLRLTPEEAGAVKPKRVEAAL
jgi:predicted tellurium resistance membrane protein TerC